MVQTENTREQAFRKARLAAFRYLLTLDSEMWYTKVQSAGMCKIPADSKTPIPGASKDEGKRL